MKVIVGGATGLIGRALTGALRARGDEVVPLVRGSAGIGEVRWDGRSLAPSAMGGADAVVNLAGENIAGRRWNESFKKVLRDSRILSTRAIVEAIRGASRKPRVLVNASAVGYYGARGDEAVDESAPAGSDFLGRMCVDWEAEAARADARVVQIRTGVVLTPAGGALQKMLLPFKAFVGGPIGSGRQWTPWIHLEDEVGAILWALDRDALRGPVNLTAPEPVTMKDFARELGRTLHRPSWAPVPAPALKLLLGEMGGMLNEGQRAVPKKLLDSGFRFRFPQLAGALRDLFAPRSHAA